MVSDMSNEVALVYLNLTSRKKTFCKNEFLFCDFVKFLTST